MSGAPKSHHYLPRHHLSRFAADRNKPQVVVYDKETGKAFRTGVLNAACENHLYTINQGETEVEKDSSTIEGMLAQLDGDGATVLDAIEQLKAVPEEGLKTMYLYIAALLLRTPYSIQRNIDAISPTMQESCERMLKFDDDVRANLRKEMDLDEDSFEDFIRKMLNGGMTVSANRAAAMVVCIQNIPKIAVALSCYRWEYLEAPDGHAFIACDNPAFICDPVTRRSENLGVLTPPVEITMPVSSRICVVGIPTRTPQVQRFRSATVDEVREVNRRTAVAGSRFVYCTDFCSEIEELASTFKNSCPISTMRKLRTPDGKLVHMSGISYPVSDFSPLLDHDSED